MVEKKTMGDDEVFKTIECGDCGNEFPFTVKEKDFYESKSFSEPKRCFPCRRAKKEQRRER